MGLISLDGGTSWDWVVFPYLEGDHFLRVWHHNCLVIDWEMGHVLIYQNGEKSYDNFDAKFVDYYTKKWKKSFNSISVGCFHWAEGNGARRGVVVWWQWLWVLRNDILPPTPH